MNTAEAKEQLIQCLDRLKLDYSIVDEQSNVQIQTIRDGVSIDVWYNNQSSQFGFTMIQGGIKSYPNIESFEQFFSIYVRINTIFVPRAKRIVDLFEQQERIQTIYETFKGREENGYNAMFNVLDDAGKKIVVSTTSDKNTYILRMLQRDNPDDKRGQIITQLTYKVNEDDEVYCVIDADMYWAELCNRYAENPDIEINKQGEVNYDFSYEDITVSATIIFDDKDVVYFVDNINGALKDKEKIILSDPYDLEELHAKALEVQKKQKGTKGMDFSSFGEDDDEFDFEPVEGTQTTEEPAQIEQSIKENAEDETQVEEEISDSATVNEETEVETQIEETQPETKVIETEAEVTEEEKDAATTETAKEDIETEEEVSEEVEEVSETEDEVEEDTEAEVETDEEEAEVEENTTDDEVETEAEVEENEATEEEIKVEKPSQLEELEAVMVKKEETQSMNEEINIKTVTVNDEVKYVRISEGKNLYDIPLELCSIPLDSIVDNVVKYKKNGLNLTDEERKTRVFAKVVDNPEEITKLENLVLGF